MTENVATASAGVDAQPELGVDAFIDQVIANEQVAEKPVEEKPAEEIKEEAKPEEAEAKETKEEQPWPKKAVNAVTRRDRKIGKLQAEISQLRTQLATNSAIEAPKEQDFEGKSYGEYLDKVVEHKLVDTQRKNIEGELKLREQEYERERADAINDSADRAKKAFPDFETLVHKNADQRGNLKLSDAAKNALLEADDGAFALYSILKDDALEELNELPLAKAAMFVARHEDKGRALSKPKTISNAPNPLTPSKGMASGQKELSDMSQDELLAWLKT